MSLTKNITVDGLEVNDCVLTVGSILISEDHSELTYQFYYSLAEGGAAFARSQRTFSIKNMDDILGDCYADLDNNL